MYRIDACPCCGSRQHESRPALISPFLSSYALGGGDKACNLLICRNCQLRFFDTRPDDSEMARLYSGYRGERYFTERHRNEFWYTRAINDGIGNDPAEIKLRKDSLAEFLGKTRNVSSFRSVLDYGGDRGQFIPDQLGTERFVYEMSDAIPIDGVTRIANEADVAKRQYDLVMVCGVFEHVSDPSEMLRKLRPLVTPAEGLICIEVPYERPSLALVPRGSLYRAYLNALQHAFPLLVLADFYSSAFRVKLNFVPPLGFVKMSEHLNFYSEAAMAALAGCCGFKIVASAIRDFPTHAGVDRVLSVLASPA